MASDKEQKMGQIMRCVFCEVLAAAVQGPAFARGTEEELKKKLASLCEHKAEDMAVVTKTTPEESLEFCMKVLKSIGADVIDAKAVGQRMDKFCMSEGICSKKDKLVHKMSKKVLLDFQERAGGVRQGHSNHAEL
mmetsp:Transcript_68410/g.121966  ORF Transcript_68410/g.121966 Transcript_68410/m.121966 type:complete len:135 (+) Transcript_68410:1-405(+)